MTDRVPGGRERDTPPRSRRKGGLTAEDVRVWRALAQTVKPLDGKNLPAEPETTPAPSPSSDPAAPGPAAGPAPGKAPPRSKSLSELSVGRPVDVDKNTGKRLSKGELPIDARLDLHGMIQEQAQQRVAGFIAQAYERGWRCVLIITGKGSRGTGVLKAEVPRWLNLPAVRPMIVAVTQAKPKDGGDGALYVLIRRKRA